MPGCHWQPNFKGVCMCFKKSGGGEVLGRFRLSSPLPPAPSGPVSRPRCSQGWDLTSLPESGESWHIMALSPKIKVALIP